MAERKQDDDAPVPPPAPSPIQETPQERVQREMNTDAAEAERKQLDETVPGGRYRTADGRTVDANGEPIKGG